MPKDLITIIQKFRQNHKGRMSFHDLKQVMSNYGPITAPLEPN